MNGIRQRVQKNTWKEINDYVMLTVASACYSLGWAFFMLPNEIAPGGIPGISSILKWAGILDPQYTFFLLNTILMAFALKILGWKFCAKTIWGVVTLTLFLALFQDKGAEMGLLKGQTFMAAIIGSAFTGTGVGLALASGGSTGGSDVVAAMVNKYKNISLGRLILFVDMIIITSSYLVLKNWDNVIMGYAGLIVASFSVDQVVNSRRRSVQFFVISKEYKEIARRINEEPNRGCTLIKAQGFYTDKETNMLFVLAKQTESSMIFRIINEVDPKAFVSQSAVIGVYGEGFDKFKVSGKKNN